MHEAQTLLNKITFLFRFLIEITFKALALNRQNTIHYNVRLLKKGGGGGRLYKIVGLSLVVLKKVGYSAYKLAKMWAFSDSLIICTL